MDNLQEVEAYCYSEKVDVSLSFGIEYNGSLDELGTDWIFEGISDSFWENYYEFEEYNNQAKEIANNKNIEYEEALEMVFGHFAISFVVDGKPVTWNSNLDINDQIFTLLSEL